MYKIQKVLMSAFTACVIAFLSLSVHAQDIAGQWQTVDDESGEAKAIVSISQNGSEYTGRIIEFLTPAPADNPQRLCTQCEGNAKNAKISNIRLIWGLTSDGNGKYSGGHILDPESGKVYKLKAKVVDGGDQLEVRGFIGVSLLGRTQVWYRVNG